MKEEIKLFIQKAAKDEGLQKKLQACKSPEEAYAIASSVQEGFTFEEFAETITKIHDAMGQNGELSDEDLAKAAGGLTDTEFLVSASVWGTITIGAAIIGGF